MNGLRSTLLQPGPAAGDRSALDDLDIRPISAADAPLMEEFGAHLSATSRYQRFFSPRGFLPGEVRRLTAIDVSHEVALIATSSAAGHEDMVGVARYVASAEGDSCEMAIVIADAWQGRGLGQRLLKLLMAEAQQHGVARMEAMVLASNKGMHRLAERLGFTLHRIPNDGLVLGMTKALGPVH